MKRLLTLALTVFLTFGLAATQTGAPQNPPAGHDHAAHHPKTGPMDGMKDHDHAMEQMHANLDAMQTTLQRMKAGLAGIKDQATRDQMQLNINLWQSMLDNMSEHLKMMEGMHHGDGMGMGMNGMHHGDMHGEDMSMHHANGMDCCKDGMSCGGDKDGKGMTCGDGKDMKCCGDDKAMSCGDGKDMKCRAEGMACGKNKTETRPADEKK